jgi:hypothetical protein
MSAFVVGHDHIDLLIDAALHADPRDRFTWYHGDRRRVLVADRLPAPGSDTGYEVEATAAGRMLLRENDRSVAWRYREPRDPEAAEAYRFRPVVQFRNSIPIEAVAGGVAQVFKAIDCFEYQACETDDWEQSEAFAFCRALRQAMCRKVDGYEAAQWEYRRDRVGVRS